MNTILMPVIFVVTLVVSLVLTPLVRRWAVGRGWVDMPGEDRRVHRRPVPRLGGLAMYAAFLVGVVLTFVFPSIQEGKVGNEQFEVSRVLLLLVGAGIITAVMAVDDVKKLKALPSLLWQIAVAVLVVVPSIFYLAARTPATRRAPSTTTRARACWPPACRIRSAARWTCRWLLGCSSPSSGSWAQPTRSTGSTAWMGWRRACRLWRAAALFVVTGPVLQQWSLAYLPLILAGGYTRLPAI